MSRGLKLAKRELTRLGCEIVAKWPGKLTFQLSGSQWTCTAGTPLPTVRAVIERERMKARAERGEYLEVFPAAEVWEVITGNNFYVTKHGREALTLMLGQSLVMREVRAALFTPEIVRVGNDGNRIYCSDRIGVVVGDRERGKHGLVTVLWATYALWEQYPRPEGWRD